MSTPKAKPPSIDPAILAEKKRASVAQLLFRCARLLDERAIGGLAARTGLPLRTSHTKLFPHVDLAGTRQSELAQRLGVSKQAVHKLVAELEELGILERRPDPADARATLVCFSSRKGRTLLDGLAALAEVDQEVARALGGARTRALHEALLALDDWLSAGAASPAAATPQARGGRGRS